MCGRDGRRCLFIYFYLNGINKFLTFKDGQLETKEREEERVLGSGRYFSTAERCCEDKEYLLALQCCAAVEE